MLEDEVSTHHQRCNTQTYCNLPVDGSYPNKKLNRGSLTVVRLELPVTREVQLSGLSLTAWMVPARCGQAGLSTYRMSAHMPRRFF